MFGAVVGGKTTIIAWGQNGELPAKSSLKWQGSWLRRRRKNKQKKN